MRSEVISRQTAERYTWGDGCDGWWLLRSDEVAVIEERMPPATSERRHLHRRARQFFYVLTGELTMELDGNMHTLTAGQGLQIAPGQPHQAMNPGGADVRFLVTSVPPSHGDRVDLTEVSGV